MGNWPFFFLLATLQVMHAYWMFLVRCACASGGIAHSLKESPSLIHVRFVHTHTQILKMVVISIANKGVQGDVREDDDD